MTCRETKTGSAIITLARLVTGDRLLADTTVTHLAHELRRNAGPRRSRVENVTAEEHASLVEFAREWLNNLPEGTLSPARTASLQARLAEAANERITDRREYESLVNIQAAVARTRMNTQIAIGDIAIEYGLPFEEIETRWKELVKSPPSGQTVKRDLMADDQLTEAANRYNVAPDLPTRYALSRIREEATAIWRARNANAPQRVTRERVNVNPWTNPAGQTFQILEYGYTPGIPGLMNESRLEIVIATDEHPEGKLYTYRRVREYDAAKLKEPDGSDYWHRHLRGAYWYQYDNSAEDLRASVQVRCHRCGQYAAQDHLSVCPNTRDGYVPRPLTSSREFRYNKVEVVVPEGLFPPSNDLREQLTTQAWETGSTVQMRLPARASVLRRLEYGPVTFQMSSVAGRLDVPHYHTTTYSTTDQDTPVGRFYRDVYRRGFNVQGPVTVEKDEETEELTVNTRALKCTCARYRMYYTCGHITLTAQAVLDRVNGVRLTSGGTPRSRMTAAERREWIAGAAARAEAAAQTDWMLDPDKRATASASWLNNTEVSYVNDVSAFLEDYKATLSEASANESKKPTIPFSKEANVLDGLSNRNDPEAIPFGVEIEFEAPYTAKQAIARDLYNAGITWNEQQVGYHGSHRREMFDTHTDSGGRGTWTYEHDGSVSGGELVTPIMYDEPETWERLEKAITIIRQHGGRASVKAGAHVHVGTKSYGNDPAPYTALARLQTQHEDVMYRLASDTGRGKHRNTSYASRLPDLPPAGFVSIGDLRQWQRRRATAINFTAVSGEPDSHPEFRLFDSSLDPGTIQAQVKMAVGVTAAARREARAGRVMLPGIAKEVWGEHATRMEARGTRAALSDAELETDTATLRSFLDTVFRRRDDKKQLVAVFAATRWTKPKSGS